MSTRLRTLGVHAVVAMRRHPVTTGYLLLLVLFRIVLGLLRPEVDERIEEAISTNLDNLFSHPGFVLLASAFLVSGSVLVSLVGVGLCVGLVERRLGSMRALGVFLCGHIGATLLTAVVILIGIAHGWYGADIRQTMDYGASYGMLASAGAVTAFVPRRWRPLWMLAVFAYPLKDLSLHPLVPDFSTFGHVFSVLIGFLIAWVVSARGTRMARPSGSGDAALAVRLRAVPAGLGAGLAGGRAAVRRAVTCWPAALTRLNSNRTRRAVGAALAGVGVVALAGVALLPSIGAPGSEAPSPTPAVTQSTTVGPHAPRHHHRLPIPWPVRGGLRHDRASGGTPKASPHPVT